MILPTLGVQVDPSDLIALMVRAGQVAGFEHHACGESWNWKD